MVILDTTVVTVALPSIARGFRTTATSLQWIVDGYTLIFASCLLLAGALGDRHDHRWTFAFGLTLFSLASAACAAAPSLGALVAARLAEGLGAAFCVPSSLAVLRNCYLSTEERSRAIGVWGGSAGLSAALGPLVGGALVQLTNWRVIFLLNVPFGLLGVLLASRVLPATPHADRSLDLLGHSLAALGLGALTVGFIEAGSCGWLSAPTLLCFGGALLAVTLLGVRGRKRSSRTVELPTAFPADVGRGLCTAIASNFVFFGSIFVLTLYLQDVLGLTPLKAGLALTPEMLMTVVGSLATGPVVSRLGARRPMAIGLLLGGLGCVALVRAGSHTSYWTLLPSFVAVGFGISFAVIAATSLVITAVPGEYAGAAAAVVNTFRQTGGAVGVAALGSLLVGAGSPVDGARLSMGVAGAVGLCVAIGVAAERPGGSLRRTLPGP